MSKNLKKVDTTHGTCRSIRHDNNETSANAGNPDTLSPLQQTIRWGMSRLAHEIRREHPGTDMLAARLMVIDELKREGWGDERQGGD